MDILSNWFQLGALPSNVITGHYDVGLVILSYIVAVLASYVALDLVGRLRTERRNRAKFYWLAGGSFAMGAGIWSMHFIGMLAFIMPMPMEYDPAWTAASLMVAMLVSALALFILQKKDYSIIHLIFGGVLIGLGIATMHYMGMEGMKTHTHIHYLPGLFFLSIAIAIAAAEAALWLILQSNRGSQKRQSYLKMMSASVMGIAICGMHYTGMNAAIFTPLMSHTINNTKLGIPANYLAFFIAGITALIIGLALTASNYYKKIVQAVENEKDFLNAMLDNLEDGIIACDAEGRITVLNNTLQKNINGTKTERTVYDIQDYFNLFTLDNKPINQENLPLNCVLNGQQVHGVELIMRFKNNISRQVIIDGQQIINAAGKKLGAVIVIHDVTELKHTEKLKNEFVSIVSHELRTPLTSIRGSLGLLVSGTIGDFSEKPKKLLEIANNNCERLLLLINDILDIEKIEAGKMDFQLKPTDLNNLISNAMDANKMYAEKFGVFLQFTKPKSIIHVIVDPDRLMQVMTNLISNACKFSPRNSQVTMTITQIPENSSVRVSIADKGAGIPEEFQKRIFQKFSQADSSTTRGKGGTGLGLNISKIIIEKLGGSLGFVSKENKGTTFYFDLPVYQEHLSKIQDISDQVQTNKKRLLICEDDEDQSEYLKVLLESTGFLIDISHTVTEAKKLLAIHKYEALLLDLILPDQDGIAFIRELRAAEKTNTLHIIVLSVITQTGRALLNDNTMGGVDWLDKPIDFHKLLTSINRIKNFQ